MSRTPFVRRTGQIPPAGSTSASTFVGRRAREASRRWLRAAKNSRFVLEMPEIRENRYRFIPERKKVRKGGITFRGRSGKLSSSAGMVDVPGRTKEVHGYRAFPDFKLLPHVTAGAQVGLATREDRFGKKRQLFPIRALTAALNRMLAIAGVPHVGARVAVWHVGRWSLMQIVYKTPIDTGTAASGWTISPQIRGKGAGFGRVGFRIGTDVEYVKYLEYGHQGYPPQYMMRSTFLEARHHVRTIMDIMIMWWKQNEVLLRNMVFDQNKMAGVVYEETERRIPNLSWHRLVAMLNERLPLIDVSELNASAALAMRIWDPKNWHTVHDFKEPRWKFEAYRVDHLIPVKQRRDFEVGEEGEIGHFAPETVGHTTVTDVMHVSLEPIPVSRKTTLEAQAKELEQIWGTSWEPKIPPKELGPIGTQIAREQERMGPAHLKGPMAEQYLRGMPGDTGRRWYMLRGKHKGGVEYK